MTIIAAQPGYCLFYVNTIDGEHTRVPVIAWNIGGDPILWGDPITTEREGPADDGAILFPDGRLYYPPDELYFASVDSFVEWREGQT